MPSCCGQALYPVPRIDGAQRLDHHVVRRRLSSQDDVVSHRTDKDVVLLSHQRNLSPQHRQRQRGELDATHRDRPGTRLV